MLSQTRRGTDQAEDTIISYLYKTNFIAVPVGCMPRFDNLTASPPSDQNKATILHSATVHNGLSVNVRKKGEIKYLLQTEKRSEMTWRVRTSPSPDRIIKQSSSISSTSRCLPLANETPAPI